MQEHLVKREDLEKNLKYWMQYRNSGDIIVVPLSYMTNGKQMTVTHFLVYVR